MCEVNHVKPWRATRGVEDRRLETPAQTPAETTVPAWTSRSTSPQHWTPSPTMRASACGATSSGHESACKLPRTTTTPRSRYHRTRHRPDRRRSGGPACRPGQGERGGQDVLAEGLMQVLGIVRVDQQGGLGSWRTGAKVGIEAGRNPQGAGDPGVLNGETPEGSSSSSREKRSFFASQSHPNFAVQSNPVKGRSSLIGPIAPGRPGNCRFGFVDQFLRRIAFGSA